MTAESARLAKQIWALCDPLRDDGISNQDYIAEVSWLLFLFLHERFAGRGRFSDLGAESSWSDLVATSDQERLARYQSVLDREQRSENTLVRAAFLHAKTKIKRAEVLRDVVLGIERLNWDAATDEFLGDVYESLVERANVEGRSGAGQYFTPRSVVEFMVGVVAPKPGDVIQDPAAGTGGFLVSAADHLRKAGHAPQEAEFHAVELVTETYRLCAMNALLHDANAKVYLGDTLTEVGANLPRATLILSNPPFGTKRGANISSRPDLSIQTSNKQLMFIQHIYQSLLPGGRAAVVVPDGVLFEGGSGAAVRGELSELCRLEGVVHLPPGLFYATGVRTSVMFFTKEAANEGSTYLVYDARTSVSGRDQRSLATELQRFTALLESQGEEELSPRAQRLPQSEFERGGLHLMSAVKATQDLEDLQAMIQQAIESLSEAREHLEEVGRALE